MKLHLVTKDQQSIEGFKRVEFLGEQIDLSDISDNECELILANDLLNDFSYSKIAELINSLTSKLRLNGSMVIGGTDYRLLCKSIMLDQIDETTACRIISSLNSVTSLAMVSGIVKSMGLYINSTQISGIHFEVNIRRTP